MSPFPSFRSFLATSDDMTGWRDDTQQKSKPFPSQRRSKVNHSFEFEGQCRQTNNAAAAETDEGCMRSARADWADPARCRVVLVSKRSSWAAFQVEQGCGLRANQALLGALLGKLGRKLGAGGNTGKSWEVMTG
jgi:hypothetical protein